MLQPTIVRYNEHKVISLPAGSIGFDTGDLLSFESNALVLMDAAGEDATFVGVSGGKRNATGDKIPVYPECWISIDVTSATYGLGAALKYVSKNTLVADGDANTIAWAWEDKTSAVTRLLVYINVPIIGLVADKLFEKVSA